MTCQIEKRNARIKQAGGQADICGTWVCVGLNYGNSFDVCVEDASDYPLEHGVTYAMFAGSSAEHVTEYMSLKPLA